MPARLSNNNKRELGLSGLGWVGGKSVNSAGGICQWITGLLPPVSERYGFDQQVR